MLNTYINDNADVPYPFLGLDRMPFPNSIITGLSVCATGNQGTLDRLQGLHVSTVTVTDKVVAIVLAVGSDIVCHVIVRHGFGSTGTAAYSADVANSILLDYSEGLALLDAAITSGTGYSTISGDFTPVYDEDTGTLLLMSQGYLSMKMWCSLHIGVVPTGFTGRFQGHFAIDPSCVTFVPESVYGFHKEVEIDGETTQLSQLLSFQGNGLLHIDSGTVHSTTEANDSQLIVTPQYAKLPMVTGINNNGLSAESGSDTDTFLELAAGSHVSLSVLSPQHLQDEQPGLVTVVTVTTTSAFKTCAGQEM